MSEPAQPFLSVVTPAPSFDQAQGLPVLNSLQSHWPEGLSGEAIVAVGYAPSRQRNLAIRAARGEWILFLDSDAQITEEWAKTLPGLLNDPENDVVGGPVALPSDAPMPQPVFQAMLAHPLFVGAARARYVAGGAKRRCDEGQLILANLAVRKRLFEQHGYFNETLYPNEENEWMDRLTKAGAKLWHDPAMRVLRSQRENWAEFVWMLFRYGIGRTRQSIVSKKVHWGKQVLGPALLFGVLFFLFYPAEALSILLMFWIVGAFMAVATYPPGEDSESVRTFACLAGPIVPMVYAAGQLAGLRYWNDPHPATRPDVPVRLFRWSAAGIEELPSPPPNETATERCGPCGPSGLSGPPMLTP